jgi:hypothetical protein
MLYQFICVTYTVQAQVQRQIYIHLNICETSIKTHLNTC